MNEDPEIWLRTAEPGWVEIENQDLIISESFVSGKDRPISVRYFSTEDKALRAKVIFGPGTQGPPGCAHGGSMAAVLDEIMAFAVWHTGCAAMSTELRVYYRKMLPIPRRCIAEAHIESVAGRKVHTLGRLRDSGSDKVFAEAEGMFLEFVDRSSLTPSNSAG